MSEMGYVALGWSVAFGAIGAYAVYILRRGRKLSRALPPGERTWR